MARFGSSALPRKRKLHAAEICKRYAVYSQFVAPRFVPKYMVFLVAKTRSLKAGQDFSVERFRIIGRLNIL